MAEASRMTEPNTEPQATPDAPVRKRPWYRSRLLVGAIVVVVFGLWRAGTFDHALYSAGLNAHDCGRNGFGAVFCGDELTQYNDQVVRPIQKAADDAQRQSDALQQQADDEAKREADYQDCLTQWANEPDIQATCTP
jgi:hypothetical protein